ncbi:MAG TPA: hypothetical protein VL325_11890 [Pyrinomonadaceae bacterium]|nr:hypothetical protein [Pyrinomonadaceae bacterium]
MNSSLLVYAIALTFFDLGSRVLTDILAERSANVVALVKSPLFVASHEPLVTAGVD